MSIFVKIKVGGELLWYEVMYPDGAGYRCRLNSSPVVEDAPEEKTIYDEDVIERYDEIIDGPPLGGEEGCQ